MKYSGMAARLLVGAAAVIFAGSIPACSCSNQGRHGGNGGNGGTGGGVGGNGSDMAAPLSGSLSIMPADVTLDLVQGMPPPTQDYKVVIHDPSGDRDVTFGCTWMVADTTLGTMNGATFTAGTSHGGNTTVTAVYTPPGGMAEMAQAMVHIRVKGTVNGPDCGGMGQPACPTFPGDNAPGCPATVAKPHIVYPSDGVLMPPNLNVMSVMWTPFNASVKSYEVDFKNAVTDVRIVTTCKTQTMDTGPGAPAASNGCEVQLTPAQWTLIAKTNAGGGAVGVSVRASSDGMCATASDSTINLNFAEQDLNGGLFYWKSTITTGAGIGGEIWAKSFGDPTPETQITGLNNLMGGCHGCHSLSRDGKVMTVSGDDNDSDDEYTDNQSMLVDVATKMAVDDQAGAAGLQVLDPGHQFYVGTNGLPSGATNGFYVTDTSMPMNHPTNVTPIGGLMDGQRPTMPDWSPDGKSLIFVLPNKVASWGHNDDDHVYGGSLYTVSWDATAHTFGTAMAFLTSSGENNFYPSYSPDGSYIVFNRVPLTGTVMNIDACNNTMATYGGNCPNDSFSNPAARILIMQNKTGGMPVDAEALNGSPAKSPLPWSNSWPRWSPFVQMYKGSKLLWVTFSSTRDYGTRVLNHKNGLVQCYPPDSPEWPTGSHFGGFGPNCQQPQIWMAAINLQQVELGQADPSFPAFWLPYQDITTHNHTAQWTQTVAGQPMPDMGMCIPNGSNCQSNPTACCSQTCLGTGVCGNPIP